MNNNLSNKTQINPKILNPPLLKQLKMAHLILTFNGFTLQLWYIEIEFSQSNLNFYSVAYCPFTWSILNVDQKQDEAKMHKNRCDKLDTGITDGCICNEHFNSTNQGLP